MENLKLREAQEALTKEIDNLVEDWVLSELLKYDCSQFEKPADIPARLVALYMLEDKLCNK